ncbi:PucR family transcriptional regulator [Georgenia thermotolerans]|uniref:PucR family transcriptional regulator n=1 Tax=Georgenia thermotolerans TaxID=527326 RepID=A0A7J5UNN6_9MICO|nr:PucR family transcriptional regulator [Georgenia thermotolerans]KAE8763995.1 PucR family transcriptional regulator [Georgenia thermotolerans]
MALTLEAVLRHPSLARGEPRVVAGAAGLQRRVRWIHSSEVLEIAALLRGGELLLTGGEMLGAASEEDQRRYVRELAARRVAGVGIETARSLPAVPPPLLAEAERLGFPVVELRRRIPFVDVAEAVNAELVNASVVRLRFGGELAHALSALLTHGGDAHALLDLVVRRTGAAAALYDSRGALMLQLPQEDGEAGGPAPSPAAGLTPSPGGLTSRITVRGAHAATLVLTPGPDSDPDLLGVVGEHASEALGLALLRSRPPSTRDLAGSELARLATAGPQERGRLTQLAQILAIDPANPVVAVALVTAATSTGLPGLDALLQRHGRVAMDASETQVRIVLSFADRRHAAHSRHELADRLAAWAQDLEAVGVGVGPVVPDLASVATSMEAAEAAVRDRATYGPGWAVDATTAAVEHLLDAPDLRARRELFVRGQLAMLLALRPVEGETLMHTLETYFDCGCNKTRTAELLHLQRQSLYGRLERAFGLLGGDPTGTDRALPLHLALRLRQRLSS